MNEAELLGFGLVAARIVPAGVLLGLLSRGLVPLYLGVGLALALAAGLSSGVGVAPALLATPSLLPFGLARELCIGFCFALAAAVPLLGLSWGVRLAEHPLRSADGPFSRLYVLAAALLVLSLGAHRAFVMALAGSLRDVPLGAPSASREPFLVGLSTIVGDAFGVALALGLPLWLALWLLDLVLALIDRTRQGSRDPGRTPERALLALLCLTLLLAPLTSRLPELTRSALDGARALLVRLAR